MGFFDRFPGFQRGSASPAASGGAGGIGLPTGGLTRTATRLIERVLDVGIDGRGQFDSARKVADDARRHSTSDDGAVDRVVADHLKLVAAGGFVTGIGGFFTLPVALPANVAGFYLLATRMAAAIGVIRGYDIDRPEVRSALLLSLVGADSEDLLKKAGYAGSGRLVNFAAERLPGPVLMAVNKGVGFRLLTQVSRKAIGRLGRGVPLIGGAVGAGVDGFMLKQIAEYVRTEFPRTDSVPSPSQITTN